MTASHVIRLQLLLRRSFVTLATPPPATSPGRHHDLHHALPEFITHFHSCHLSRNNPTTTACLARPHPRRGVDYRSKIVLAPMVRSGELPSRLLALHYGADLVWGPETVDRSMIGTTFSTNPRTGCYEWSRVSNNPAKESVLYRIDPVREAGKLIFQIGTNSPTRAVEAASLFAPHVAGIDVNAGCPKPFSTSGGMGAALLRTPDHLASILSALVTSVGIPHEIGISVKIRLLETPEATSHLVHTLCKTGIIGLTIHCRTTPMRPRERAIRQQLRMIGDICRSYGVACLMNGDVTSRAEGLALASEYGVDGAMIATAAEANSSVFRKPEDGGLAPWQEVVSEYFSLALSVENKFGNTKFLLSQLIPGKSPVYQKVQMSKSHAECAEVLGLDHLKSRAEEVDHILQLDVAKITARDVKKENKRLNRERHEANIARKRALEVERQQNDQYETQAQNESQERSKKHKAVIGAENAGFEGMGRGAMAVAG